MIRIEVLYPEVCNLYGDLANPKYLARCSGAEIVETDLKSTPAFTKGDINLVYIGTTTERGQSLVRDALRPYADALKERTAEGGLTFVNGNVLEVFGEYIRHDDGTEEEMLGFYPVHAERDMIHRYNSLYIGNFRDETAGPDGIDVIGFKSQFAHSYGDNGSGLFTTERGPGLNPDVKAEGIRDNNFMATYVIGPIMLMNPLFNRWMLSAMGAESPLIEFEEAAMDVYNTRIAEFREPARGFTY